MSGANDDIRAEARKAGVTLWALAHEIGVSEATMTRRMRLELRADEKARLREAIGAISQRGGQTNENENNQRSD